jgi:hypothetical protein
MGTPSTQNVERVMKSLKYGHRLATKGIAQRNHPRIPHTPAPPKSPNMLTHPSLDRTMKGTQAKYSSSGANPAAGAALTPGCLRLVTGAIPAGVNWMCFLPYALLGGSSLPGHIGYSGDTSCSIWQNKL